MLQQHKPNKVELNKMHMIERQELQKLYEYNPFGRGGAGAPIKDNGGNLLTARKGIADGKIYQETSNPYITNNKGNYFMNNDQYMHKANINYAGNSQDKSNNYQNIENDKAYNSYQFQQYNNFNNNPNNQLMMGNNFNSLNRVNNNANYNFGYNSNNNNFNNKYPNNQNLNFEIEQNIIPKLNQNDNTSERTQKMLYQSDLLRQMQEDTLRKKKAKQAEKDKELMEEQKYKDFM